MLYKIVLHSYLTNGPKFAKNVVHLFRGYFVGQIFDEKYTIDLKNN
jgi:hypothetical protein